MIYVIHKKLATPEGASANAHIERVRENCIAELRALPTSKAWRVEITEYRKKRSLDQNAYLHAVPLKMISDKTGYDIEDVKQYLCGEWSGWNETEVFGQKRLKPTLTTSQMDTAQMTEFIDWLVWYGAEKMGLTIPYPNEEVA